MIEQQLFWERYRPKSLKSLILLPRISEFVKNGIQTNIIFHGYMGTGKTSLTRILLQNKHFIQINSSLDNGIDVLRDQLSEFCQTMPSPFVKTDDKTKYVYLSEFDNSTKDFQEAFKDYIEEYSHIRFIITMNHLSNIKVKELNSRFSKINFNPINNEEKLFLQNGYLRYLKAVAADAKVNVSDDTITKIINKNFPDLRSSVQNIQEIFITGKEEEVITNIGDRQTVYDMLLSKNMTFEHIWDFVVDNYNQNPDELLHTLGRPLFEYLKDYDINIIRSKGRKIIRLSAQYTQSYNNLMVDPVIHLISYMCDIKEVLDN